MDVCILCDPAHRTARLSERTDKPRASRSTQGSKQCLTKDYTLLSPHRSEVLFSIFVVLKPGVPFLTMKALTCFVSVTSRAQMITTSANVALPAVRVEHADQRAQRTYASRGAGTLP